MCKLIMWVLDRPQQLAGHEHTVQEEINCYRYVFVRLPRSACSLISYEITIERRFQSYVYLLIFNLLRCLIVCWTSQCKNGSKRKRERENENKNSGKNISQNRNCTHTSRRNANVQIEWAECIALICSNKIPIKNASTKLETMVWRSERK